MMTHHKRLKPAKNVRETLPRVCATCKHLNTQDGSVFCEREGGIEEHAGDLIQWVTTCDRYTKSNDWSVG